jgi:hypothetical protein
MRLFLKYEILGVELGNKSTLKKMYSSKGLPSLEITYPKLRKKQGSHFHKALANLTTIK